MHYDCVFEVLAVTKKEAGASILNTATLMEINDRKGKIGNNWKNLWSVCGRIYFLYPFINIPCIPVIFAVI